jgi:hypothetical protein
MRTMRLGREFDAVLVHDAVMYMTSEADLLAAARTAFAHTRAGGAAIFAPDCVRETFEERASMLAADDGGRSLRGIEWTWDPDPRDDTYIAEYAFLLREDGQVRSVHDRHVEGLFAKATWERVLAAAGFRVGIAQRSDEGNVDEVFLCRKA